MIVCLARQCRSIELLNRHIFKNGRRSIAKRSHIKSDEPGSMKERCLLAIDRIKIAMESEESVCHFPIIKDLGMTTDEKMHNISISSDHIMRYINMGFINKNLALQYCHYLVHVSKNSPKNYKDYYSKRSCLLISYLLRNNNDIITRKLGGLACDISTTTVASCSEMCQLALDHDEKLELSSSDYTNLLVSCYNFDLWAEADLLLKKHSKTKKFGVDLFDRFVSNFIRFTSIYNHELELNKKRAMKTTLFEHFFNLMEACFKDRMQLITRQKSELVQALKDFGIKVAMNPQIKQSGRCLSCGSYLPLYDIKSTPILNKSIKEVLDSRVLDSKLYTERHEVEDFMSFLQRVLSTDNKPIDCVIDGLNLAYRNTRVFKVIKKTVSDDVEQSIKLPDQASQAQILINIILRGSYLEDYRKILVIGRRHMERWPNLTDFFKKYKIHYYTSANDTKDDLFQLYAATLSPNTVLSTNDFLRDHLALMEGDSRILLERWIDTHQVWTNRKSLLPSRATKFEKLPSVDRKKETLSLTYR